jgi:hypothetical protein
VNRADRRVDVADVDAKLEQAVATNAFSLPCLSRCSVEPLLGKAAVMRAHLVPAEPVRQLPGDTLGQPARVDEINVVRARW